MKWGPDGPVSLSWTVTEGRRGERDVMSNDIVLSSHGRRNACREVRRLLDERATACQLRNVSTDEEAARKSFAFGVYPPPILVHGFDAEAIEIALEP